MMDWTEILSAVGEALGLPAMRPDPVSAQLASEFLAAVTCCEAATGRRPDQVALTADDSLAANYWGTAGHGVLEVYPQDVDDDPDDGRLVIAAVLAAAEGQPWAVGIHLHDALAGDEFREMAKRIGEWCDSPATRALVSQTVEDQDDADGKH